MNARSYTKCPGDPHCNLERRATAPSLIVLKNRAPVRSLASVPDASHFLPNLQRGSILLNQNRPREALPFLQAAIAANPDRPEGYAELARCWIDLPAQRGKALAAIDRAIALAPNVSFYHGCKAWYLVCLMRYHAALRAARDGLAIDPNCPKSLNGLANAYTKLNQWKKAEQTCRRILADDPNDIPGLNLLAQALRHQGRWKETRQVVAQLLALTPNNAFGQANAGYAALAAGDHLRANEHFLASLRLNPHFDLARRGLLQSLRARIWIIRWNMRISSLVRWQPNARELLYIVSAVILIAMVIFGLVAGLNWIHPNAGMAVPVILIILFEFSFFGLVLWIFVSLVVAIFGNFLLLFDPLGRHALTWKEKIFACLATWIPYTMLMAALVSGGAWQVAAGFTVLLALLALSIEFPLIRDRWLRRRLEKSEP
jgi:tetratricopeptide (TPR) repeat protein